jgi:hypothetical protein
VVDYYNILGVKPNANPREIKSAYRRLAKRRHPDLNGNDESAGREFARLTEAYRVLSDARERAVYDQKLVKARNGDASVVYSANPHAERLRRIAVQTRMNRIVDSFIEAERRETFMLQQAVFPTVSLFLSILFVGMLKPRLWESSGYFGRTVLLLLFVGGLYHLITRLRTCFERYTYQPAAIHDSIMNEPEPPEQPFTRFKAIAFLVLGSLVCLGVGLLIGEYLQTLKILADMSGFFAQHLQAELIFYPPIVVLIIDTMHSVTTKLDGAI